MPIDWSKKEGYTPTPDEAAFIIQAYTDFIYDRRLRMQSLNILNGRTLQQFWDDSEYDYNVLVEEQNPNDPVVPYASSITRDKTNTFITSLSQQLLYPSVSAQNKEQELDRVISRASRGLLEWQYNNDGRPAESGTQKNSRYIHNMAVTGTVLVQDDFTSDGKLVSSFVPNEELYIPNLYEPNIQNQAHILRMQNATTYEQAELEFCELANFEKYVVPMASAQMWLTEQAFFQQLFEAINPKDAVHILRVQRPVPYKKLQEYKKSGKLPSHVKQAKYYNIVINGVLMFPPENLSPYWHGFYNISKGIFESFSRANFFYGNSISNKARHDKKWLDGWKTLIRYKAKLSTIPPLITLNGSFVDSDIVVPGMITQAPAGMGKDDILAVPGLSNGLSDADLSIMRDATSDIDRSTTAPQTAGQTGSSRTTAREALIVEANAQKAMQGFAMQIAYLVEARTFPILKSTFQFLPRASFKKLVVGGQKMSGGGVGDLEVIFTKPMEMDGEQLYETEKRLFSMEQQAAKAGRPKSIVFINEEYVHNLDFYCKAEADSLIKDTAAIREARAEMHFNTYASHPEIFNTKAAGRRLIQEYGDDETEMLVNLEEKQGPTPEQLSMMQEGGKAMGQGQGSGSGQNPLEKMNDQSGARVANNASAIPAY